MEHGFKTVKTPTCILFNEKKEFKKFGYDAVMKYNTLPSSEAPKWYFFQNFKMKLYNQVSGSCIQWPINKNIYYDIGVAGIGS